MKKFNAVPVMDVSGQKFSKGQKVAILNRTRIAILYTGVVESQQKDKNYVIRVDQKMPTGQGSYVTSGEYLMEILY